MSVDKLQTALSKGQCLLILGQNYLDWMNTSLDSLAQPLAEGVNASLKKDDLHAGLRNVYDILVNRQYDEDTLRFRLCSLLNEIKTTDSLSTVFQVAWQGIFTTAIDDCQCSTSLAHLLLKLNAADYLFLNRCFFLNSPHRISRALVSMGISRPEHLLW